MALIIEAEVPRIVRGKIGTSVKNYLIQHGFRKDGDKLVYGGSEISGSGATQLIEKDIVEASVEEMGSGIRVRFTRSSGDFYNGVLVGNGRPAECSEVVEELPKEVFGGHYNCTKTVV